MNSSDDATGRNISEDDLNFLDFREDAEESFFGEETFFFFLNRNFRKKNYCFTPPMNSIGPQPTFKGIVLFLSPPHFICTELT